MEKKILEKLIIVPIDGQPTYPNLAKKIYNDTLFGPRIQRRVQRLLLDHPEGLNERGHDWYFGYLVCAYTQVYFGIKNLLNYQSVTQEIFQYCFQQEN